MARFLIPTIGTIIQLTEDWTFVLHEERRNEKFANQPLLNFGYKGWPGGQHLPDPNNPGRTKWVPNTTKTQSVTLPKGTKLRVARIYIRNGGGDMKNFDSVTFFCNFHLSGAKAKKAGALKGRFWAKLIDVNNMDVAYDPETMPLAEFA